MCTIQEKYFHAINKTKNLNCFFTCISAAHARMTRIENGAFPSSTLLVNNHPDEKITTQQLQYFIEKISDVKLPVVSGKEISKKW